MASINRLTCQETFERLDDYLDRELSAGEMRLVIEHLEVCAFCLLEFQFEARLLRELRARLRAMPVPETLLTKVRNTLAAAQRDRENEDRAES